MTGLCEGLSLERGKAARAAKAHQGAAARADGTEHAPGQGCWGTGQKGFGLWGVDRVCVNRRLVIKGNVPPLSAL